MENKCAILFLACSNRNQSLFNALINYLELLETEDNAFYQRQKKRESNSLIETKFAQLIAKYDFMSIVMYPDLKNRREFVHDCWSIAKATENEELKLAITNDKFFYLNR